MSFGYENYQSAKYRGAEETAAAQAAMLRRHLLYAAESSAAYREMFVRSKLDPAAIGPARLSLLPFTEKKDIEARPEAYLAVPRERVADIVLSSGTTGKPLAVHYTEGDLKRLAYNEAQSFAACGVTSADTALMTCTMDRCFIAGLAYFLGLRETGATVIRNGHGLIESHAALIETLRPTLIVGVPTFLKKLALAMLAAGQNPAEAGVRKLVCIGEPLRGEGFGPLGIGKELEELWNARAFSTYASSETITTFCECSEQKGGHLLPELAVVEIVDDAGRVLPAGEKGEVVITPMAVEGMPLIRYKTGDISFLDEGPCPCGRFSPRLGPVLGRKNQRMKVKGTSLYPEAVYEVLEDAGFVENYYLEVFDESELSEKLVVHVSLKSGADAEKLAELFTVKLRVRPEIAVENDEAIRKKIFTPRSRKPVRFFDLRKAYAKSS